MADFAALPLFTDAYLADTRHLTTTEHGAYFLLLMEAWRRPSCSLPDDDRLLARLAGLSEAEWAAIRETVMAFWTLDGRRKEWRQKRLAKEREYVAVKSAIQRDKAAKRWNKSKKEDAAAMPGPMPKPCPADAPSPTPTPSYSDPNGSASSPRDEDDLDPEKVLWDRGLRFMVKGGVPEARARSMIGKWRKTHDALAVIKALGRAQRECPSDLIPFITGCLEASGPRPVSAANRGLLTQKEREDLDAAERSRKAKESRDFEDQKRALRKQGIDYYTMRPFPPVWDPTTRSHVDHPDVQAAKEAGTFPPAESFKAGIFIAGAA